LHDLGAVFAGSRRPQQARIDLSLALGAGLGAAAIRELFDG
jgi:L-asparaginase/Glu-tRNA(Gln) amidotransferase subunit D